VEVDAKTCTVVVPTATAGGIPTKIKSGEVIKPPPIPNKPEINPIPIPREIRR
jgi:hypothetical protein